MNMLDHRHEQVAPLLEQLWQELEQCLKSNGLKQSLAVAGCPGTHTELREDPFDKSQNLYIEWRNESGRYLGNVLVHDSNQLFAEFDVLQPHPSKPQWFVESATAWGRPGALKSELRLLSALGE